MLSAFGVKVDPEDLSGLNARRDRRAHLNDLLTKRYQEKEELIGPENMREAERIVMLNVIDNQWKDHLLSMDHLKEGIGLRGYGQKDPLIEYKKESFTMFQDMMDRIEDETIRYLFFLQVTDAANRAATEPSRNGGPQPAPCCRSRPTATKKKRRGSRRGGRLRPRPTISAAPPKAPWRISLAISSARRTRKWPSCNSSAAAARATEKKQAISDKKAGRNDPCPCGSGKKYKKCHGA